jgi:hypothetical protein
MIFCNLFIARPYAQRLRQLVFKCLFDEQFEVRTVASVTLSGFYQCGYIQVNDVDLVNILFYSSFHIDLFCRNIFVGWVKQVTLQKLMERKWHQLRTLSKDMEVSWKRPDWILIICLFVRCSWPLCYCSFQSIWYPKSCTRSIDVTLWTFTWSWSYSGKVLFWV